MCNEPIVDITDLAPEIQDKVYRPKPGESYNVDLGEGEIFKGEVRVVDEEVEDEP